MVSVPVGSFTWSVSATSEFPVIWYSKSPETKPSPMTPFEVPAVPKRISAEAMMTIRETDLIRRLWPLPFMSVSCNFIVMISVSLPETALRPGVGPDQSPVYGVS